MSHTPPPISGYVFSVNTERNLMFGLLAVTPALMYFHTHRKVLLASSMAQKGSSYYNP